MLCSVTPDGGPLFCAKRSVFRLTFRQSAGTELDCCGCFSGSTLDTAELVSLVAASPTSMSLADGKELEHFLKNVRRAMSVDLQYTWPKSERGTKLKNTMRD